MFPHIEALSWENTVVNYYFRTYAPMLMLYNVFAGWKPDHGAQNARQKLWHSSVKFTPPLLTTHILCCKADITVGQNRGRSGGALGLFLREKLPLGRVGM